MCGRGSDNSSGNFLIKGKLQEDVIHGLSLLMQKSFVVLNDNDSTNVHDWLMGGESGQFDDDDEKKFTAHVNLMGYCALGHPTRPPRGNESDGPGHADSAADTGHAQAEADNEEELFDDERKEEEQQTGAWGVGMFGVWETASSGAASHFQLQKGGVFRAQPLFSSFSPF